MIPTRLKAGFLGVLLGAAAIPQGYAINVTVTGDPIGGGELVGSTFTIAPSGLSAGNNSYPANEAPPFAIDDNAGASKYLNGAGENTGYIVTPALGLSNVTGIDFTTANDSPDRDPASYSLYGSTTVVANSTAGSTFTLTDFTLINSNAVALSTTRFDSTVSAAFANAGNYTTYLLVFPTIRNNGQALMQIGDAVLTGTAVPEPGSILFALVSGAGVLGLRRRRA